MTPNWKLERHVNGQAWGFQYLQMKKYFSRPHLQGEWWWWAVHEVPREKEKPNLPDLRRTQARSSQSGLENGNKRKNLKEVSIERGKCLRKFQVPIFYQHQDLVIKVCRPQRQTYSPKPKKKRSKIWGSRKRRRRIGIEHCSRGTEKRRH